MKIGNVTLDLSRYSGSDAYSDGDIEDALLDIVDRGLTFEEALAEHPVWPVVYHLTPLRENILSWYPFKQESRILEVGAGCGAVTGTLVQNCRSVVANDLSKRRAQILATRHQYADNLEVVVGNLNDMGFKSEFDYVSLIGVLEYAGKFTSGSDPFVRFLGSIKKMLRPEGTLLIAIENRYGLKYWGGAPEDHTGLHFDGIEGYARGTAAKTFSKRELIQTIERSGLSVADFYYPLPDYKMPTKIFSDRHLPGQWEIDDSVPDYLGKTYPLFDSASVWSGIIAEGLFPFYANSFLVECKRESEE